MGPRLTQYRGHLGPGSRRHDREAPPGQDARRAHYCLPGARPHPAGRSLLGSHVVHGQAARRFLGYLLAAANHAEIRYGSSGDLVVRCRQGREDRHGAIAGSAQIPKRDVFGSSQRGVINKNESKKL